MAPVKNKTGAAGGKIKILVVEDDKFLSRAFNDKLIRAGFEVYLATDGNEAMNHVRSRSPNLVLLDLVLPFKNGFEFLEELKTDDEYRGIPVIILTNLGQEQDIKRGIELGAEDYLIKSNISIKDVVWKVKEVLAKKKVKKDGKR